MKKGISCFPTTHYNWEKFSLKTMILKDEELQEVDNAGEETIKEPLKLLT